MYIWQLSISFFLFTNTNVEARCSSNNCEKFSCVSDFYVHRPFESYRGSSTFNSPCSCANDWNAMFCNQTLHMLTLSDPRPFPTVCICRKFSDDGAKCQQFMTRCFSRRHNECSCCFNQPSEWCNQLQCKNREPDFSNANTTCVCYHNPSDYPIDVCKNLFPRDNSWATRGLTLEKNLDQHSTLDTEVKNFDENNSVNYESDFQYIKLLGTQISTSTITFMLIGLLLTVSALTLIMLLLGGRKLRRRQSERRRQIRLARETLIMQRADDDRYLPTA